MLYFKDQLYIIDVSQSVELDHPMALDFLRRDCVNINDYFDKQNIQTLTTEKAFDFITDTKISSKDMDSTLKALLEQNEEEIKSMTFEERRKREMDDKVFQQMYIPRNLQLMSFEDIDKLNQNQAPDVFIGKTGDSSAPIVTREFQGIGTSLKQTLQEEAEGEETEEAESEGEGED
mmetsp:Transcript_34171/g.33752  ORF Transcript_34171/g.33752 Transcript_34171/m.33752 type:complete len:176 (-) Transcript_34171:172-699(-)